LVWFNAGSIENTQRYKKQLVGIVGLLLKVIHNLFAAFCFVHMPNLTIHHEFWLLGKKPENPLYLFNIPPKLASCLSFIV